MALKYTLIGDTEVVNGITLHRIKRLSDGLLGGYIESEQNLSQEGSCFLFDHGRAYGAGKITGDAQVYGAVYENAIVSGNASVKGEAFGQASVLDQAELEGRAYERAIIRGNAKVFGEAFGDSITEGSARVYGRIFGTAHVSGNDVVYGDRGS